ESFTTSHLVSTRSSIRDTKMLRSIGHHVGGQQFAGKGSRTQPVFNPAIGEQTGVLSLASKADVDTAVEVAANAFEDRAATTPLRRAPAFPGLPSCPAPRLRSR